VRHAENLIVEGNDLRIPTATKIANLLVRRSRLLRKSGKCGGAAHL
jgi:hypothetical protein